MHALVTTIALAEVRWGYRRAATLEACRLTVSHEGPDDAPGPPHRVLEGRLGRDVDLFACRQAPLTLVVPRPGGAWRWPIVSITLGAVQASLELGEKERVNHVAVRTAGQ